MHKSVLLHESVDALRLGPNGVFLDGTLGSGGHSASVIKQYGDSITLIGLDRDQDALRRSDEILRDLGAKFFLVNSSFRNLDKVLEDLGISSVDAVLFDLGLSSNQFEESGRGFTFQKNEPLLMTMSENPSETDLTARWILNNFSESALELILKGFGEEKYSKRIASEIVRRREIKPFEDTFDLVAAVESAVPNSYRHGRINPATRTFQAIRIATNEELTALEEGLSKAWDALAIRGRLAVISFHSLEDRIVKQFFKDLSVREEGKLISKKPIKPSDEEVAENPRSRSAKLRVIEKI